MRLHICSNLRWLCAAAGFALLAGCASNPPAPVVDLSLPNENAQAVANTGETAQVYRVTHGDTLYSIAFNHSLDYRDLATWNSITAPYRILVGQSLRLTAPAAPEPIAEPQPGAAVTAGIAQNATMTAPIAAASAVSKPSAFEAVPTQPASNPPPVAAAPAPAPAQPAAATPPPNAVESTPPKPVAIAPAPAASTAELSAGGVNWQWPADGKVIGTFVSGDQTRQGLDVAGNAGDPVRAAADGEVVYSGNGLIGYGELIIVKHNANFLSAYGHNRKRLVKEGERVKAGQEIAEMGSTSASRDELHFEIRKNGKPVNPLDYLPAR
ncbi:MAG: peptidoglycan DD-metalloendopeptidase family protein [Rudaea sp.]